MFRHESFPFIEPKLNRPKEPRGLLIALSVFAVFVWFWQAPRHPQPIQITYSEFQTLVREGRVVEVLLLGDQVYGVLNAPIQPRPDTEPNRHVTTGLATSRHHKLGSFLAEHGVPLSIRPMIGPI